MKNQRNGLYQAVAETMYAPLLGTYRTYGILARRRTAGGWEEIEMVHDVTTEAQFAVWLSELFSFCQLSPLHLRDVLNDMLP